MRMVISALTDDGEGIHQRILDIPDNMMSLGDRVQDTFIGRVKGLAGEVLTVAQQQLKQEQKGTRRA